LLRSICIVGAGFQVVPLTIGDFTFAIYCVPAVKKDDANRKSREGAKKSGKACRCFKNNIKIFKW